MMMKNVEKAQGLTIGLPSAPRFFPFGSQMRKRFLARLHLDPP